MGDKPEKFVNSRQWIGSVEVGYVMASWVGTQHRIQFVSSGGSAIFRLEPCLV
jgi:hypothetical protein